MLVRDAIPVYPDSNRVATLLSNGIRPPDLGDVMLLLLDPAAVSIAESHGGVPTQSPVPLDGVA